MSMSPGFDPQAKTEREISRRVRRALAKLGETGIPPRGYVRPHTMSSVGRVHGQVITSSPDLLEATLADLEQNQVLDDLAGV